MDTLTDAMQSLEPEIRRKYRRKMRCIAYRCDLDDLIQAIYLKAWKHRHTCRGASEKAVRTWLRVVAANVFRSCINQHLGCANRDVKRESSEPVEHYCNCDPSLGVEVTEAKQQARKLIRKLPERHRLAVRLRFIREREYADVATEMGISVHRARTLATTGVRRMRELVLT